MAQSGVVADCRNGRAAAAEDAVCPAFVLTAGGSRLFLGGWHTPLCFSITL